MTTIEEREKNIRIANMLIGVINDLERPMLMTQTEKDVAKEALENYVKMLEQQPCEDVEEYELNEQMQFPETFEEFTKEFGFKDDKEVYTNGSDLIPIFRVKQWLEQSKSLEQIKWEAIDKEEISKSVVLLDLFMKTFCRYRNDYERFDDLRFRCSECPFCKDNGDCLIKIFKNKYAPDYREFGSMGDL